MSAILQKQAYRVIITEDKNEGVFVGNCPHLHAHSQGDTYQEILANMSEAVGLAAEVLEGVRDFNMLIVRG